MAEPSATTRTPPQSDPGRGGSQGGSSGPGAAPGEALDDHLESAVGWVRRRLVEAVRRVLAPEPEPVLIPIPVRRR